ncbi:MAG: hypothetical protein AAGF30_07345, partial [Pseudomonadota bacterium]
HADYAFGDNDTRFVVGLDDEEGWSGSVELGLEARLADRIDLRISAGVGRLGTDTVDVDGRMRLTVSF